MALVVNKIVAKDPQKARGLELGVMIKNMKLKYLINLFIVILMVGCTKVPTKNKPNLNLTSNSSSYNLNEKIEFIVNVNSGQFIITIPNEIRLIHWQQYNYTTDNSSGGGSFEVNETENNSNNSFNFKKPNKYWSSIDNIVLEYKAIQYFNRCQNMFYELLPEQNSKTITIKSHTYNKLHKTINPKTQLIFNEPGIYALRATLNQPNHFPNPIKYLSSNIIYITIKTP